MRLFRLSIALLAVVTGVSQAQEVRPYSFRQSFSAFTEYSNASSHIILGASRDRRLVALGFTFSRRLLHTPFADWYYAPEIRPFALIQDPVAFQTLRFNNSTFSQSLPLPGACKSGAFSEPADPATGFPGYTFTQTCGTRWTYAGGISPLGQRINIAPRNRLQPFAVCNAGFLVSPRDVPLNNSSRFNFTFEFGGGFEFFHDRRHSWSVEYRIHHLSNAYTGTYNPGVDSQIFKLTYSLSR